MEESDRLEKGREKIEGNAYLLPPYLHVYVHQH